MQIKNELLLNEKEWNKVSNLEPDRYYSATKEGYIIYFIGENIKLVSNEDTYDIEIVRLVLEQGKTHIIFKLWE